MTNTQPTNGAEIMTSRHEARYSENSNGVYTYIVRIDRDGFTQVIQGFNPRHFATRKNAERATAKHFARFLSN